MKYVSCIYHTVCINNDLDHCKIIICQIFTNVYVTNVGYAVMSPQKFFGCV